VKKAEQNETDSWNNEQSMAAMSGAWLARSSPSLAWVAPPPFDHVLGDARLRDLKPSLSSFAVDAARPMRIFERSSGRDQPARALASGPASSYWRSSWTAGPVNRTERGSADERPKIRIGARRHPRLNSQAR